MAGKRNPWGSTGGSGGGDGGDEPGKDGPAAGGDAPGGSEPGSGGEPPRGPRNPWLPGGGAGDGGNAPGDRPRRSASIDDIFRNRSGDRRRPGGGGGGRPPQFRLPERPGGKSWFPVALVAVGALWVGVTSVHFIQAGEQGVVTWFGGKYAKTLQTGAQLSLPWPIQSVSVENVTEIRRFQIPGGEEENLILTADQNLVNLTYQVRWNISDLVQYRFQLVDPEGTLREIAEATMRSAVAEQELDEVLAGAGVGRIEGQVREAMQDRLDAFRSGITVQGIDVMKADAPAQVIEAFNDVLAARQDAERNRNDARRYEQQLLAQAQGEAAAFNTLYEQYRMAPEVTRRRMYYETMEQVLANTDKTVVEAGGVTPYLPLPELRRSTPQGVTTSAEPTSSATRTGGQ
ncbi:protease modulator HflK [Altererythrobacter buctensis]|uniref:Protease modulator HflK n=2 Tax=Alteraurantiacibacter buctensis TaxID=1503981 RepID=A0A844YWQ7_9SPHN|nr:protease modulator HflK [Alteraurantiacibacter buctensis]